jgi:hypothetical protein
MEMSQQKQKERYWPCIAPAAAAKAVLEAMGPYQQHQQQQEQQH